VERFMGARTTLAGVAIALALCYAALIPRSFPFVSAAVVGVGYSFVVVAVMTTMVLPSVNPAMRAAMLETDGAWVLAYAAFGLALGSVPWFRQHFSAPRGNARGTAPEST
jgi:hypothetical protein